MLKKIIILMLSFCTVLSAENMVVDTGRNENLQLDKAANGVPLVNIETPNKKGISHNIFREYNVDQKGVILNNALEMENSKLGGLIYGNPNLQGNRQNASTIVTEVSGVNRSNIEGFTEIVGKKADYILANPNGIYINGAGFINTGNVQFTTGDSQHLQNPEKGQIEIAGKGLDVRNVNKAELIARTAMLTAPMYGGEEVHLQLGSQTTREKPEFALDARNLGSIYAGKINIVSNEEGVGVKSSAPLYASLGDVLVDSKGKIYLQEVQAKKGIRIRANETEVNNALLSEENIQIQNNFLKNRGNIKSNGRILIEGNIKNEGSIVSHDTFHAKSSNVSNEGDISAKTIEIDSDILTNTEQIKAKDLISMKSKQIHNAAEIVSHGKVQLQADHIKNQKLLSKEGIEIIANSLQSHNMIYSEKDLKMKSDIIQNTGKIVVKGDIQAKARKIENTGKIESTGTTQLQAEMIENHELFSNNIKLEATKIENTTKMVAENSLELQAKIAKNHGNIYAGKESKFQVGDFQNKGEITSTGTIQVQAEKFQNKKLLAKEGVEIAAKSLESEESLYTEKDLNITSDNIRNLGRLQAKKNMSLTGIRMENKGDIFGENLVIEAEQIENKTMLAKGNIQMRSKILTSENKIQAEKDVHIQSNRVENKGNFLSGKEVSIKSNALINHKNILGKNRVEISTNSLENDATQGTIYSENEAKIKADEIELTKNIVAKNQLSLDTKNLKRSNSYITNSDLRIHVDGDYSNHHTLIGKSVFLTAKNLSNHSILASQENVELFGKENTQNHKNSILYSAGKMKLAGGNLENHGDILSQKDAILHFSGDVDNLSANLFAEGNLKIQAKNFRNQGHLTGDHTKKWVAGYRSNINVNQLPKEFLEEIDALLEQNRQGRKFRGWDEEKRLDGAEQGISRYVSHKSYTKAGNDLILNIENEVLNQEADLLADGNIEIKADTVRNARKGKEIDIILQFARRYHYRHRRKNGSRTTKHGDIYASKKYKETLYSDKPTQIIAGGDIQIQAKQLGNGEEKRNTNSETKTINSPFVDSNVGNIDASFRVSNNSLVDKIKQEAAITVKDYLEIPSNEDGMFILNKKKEHPKFSYLMETNPKLIHREFYLGSDYFFSRIGFNPDRDIRLLGDSFYEHRLISKAVLEGTGKRYLYSQDVNAERKALFDNAIAAQKDLQLSLGVSLSKEQINRLQKDILWYVEEEVAGEKVLVPRLYLSKTTLQDIQENTGNHIQAGGHLQIDALALDNNGKIIAKENVSIHAKNILQNAAYEGTGMYGKNISLFAEKDIVNIGGNIKAEENVTLYSQAGDIRNQKKLSVHENNLRNVFTDVRGSGEIQGENIKILANQVENLGADIRAKETLEIGARENLQIGSVEAVDQKIEMSKRHFVKDRKTQNIASNLEASKISLQSQGEITVLGSNVVAKEDININSGKDTHIIAGKNTSLHEEKHSKSKSFGRSSESVDIDYTAEHVSSNLIGKNVRIASAKNISILGSNVQAGVQGEVGITAKGDITQAGVKDIHYSFHEKTKTGFLGLTKKTKTTEQYQEEAIKTVTASGTKGIVYDSENDLVLEGVNVVSTGRVQMKGKQIEINPLETESWRKTKEKKRGFAGSFGRGNLSVSYGTDKKEQNTKNRVQNTSQITAGKDIQLYAKEKLQGRSVELYAKDDIEIQGKQGVEFTAAKNIREVHRKQSSNRLGVSVGVKSELVNTIENVKNVKKLTDFSGNAYDVANTASKLVGAMKDGAATINTVTTERYGEQKNENGSQSAGNDNYRTISTDWKDYVSANVGLSKSKSESRHSQEEAVKNTIESGGNVAIISKEGSVSLEGTDIHTAKNLQLLAKDKVEVKATREENASSSSSSQRGLSAGISASGVSLTASASGQKGKGDGTSYMNSHLNVGGDYKVLAKDIVHEGANVEANTIHMQGENIRISSIQDVSKQKDSSYGGSLSVNLTNPALSSGSLSGSRGKGEGAWVKEQSSLLAKEGGSIVAKDFENVGSIVGSRSEENKLQVQADRVHVEDLEDKNKYENKGGGISLSSSVPNISVQHDKVDKEQATRATAVNTNFVVAGEQKTSEELGFNTDLSKAQEVTKDEEKHLDAELHTDLLGKDKQEELARAGNVLKDIQKAIVNKDNTKGDFAERYRQGRIMRGIAEEIQKNPEWLSVFEVTPENTGKTPAEVERVRAAVYNQAMNGFLKAHGYQPQYDEEGKEINPIMTIVTDIADPNTPMYMSAGENKFVIDRKYLLSLSREQAMNGIGHEFGHYSTQDEIVTKDQSVANYTGSLLEKHTKKIESKPISEATWNGLLNTSSVITGPGAEIIASGIAVNEREYYTHEFFITGGTATDKLGFAKASITKSSYTSYDFKNDTAIDYEGVTKSFGIGTNDFGGAIGVGIYTVDTPEEMSKLNKSYGGSASLGVLSFGIDILSENTSNMHYFSDLLNPRGIRVYVGLSSSKKEAHLTTIDIGEVKIKKISPILEYWKSKSLPTGARLFYEHDFDKGDN